MFSSYFVKSQGINCYPSVGLASPLESIFPRVGITLKDFVFVICYLHGSCNNFKGRSTPFTRFCRFLLSRHKRNRQKKKTSLSRRAAFSFASIFAPLSADCESSAYLVFGFAEWFRCFFSHSSFSEAVI